MIELFDPARLATRRDRTLQAAGGLLLLGLLALGLRTWQLQRQIGDEQAQAQRAAAALAELKSRPAAPTAALIGELEQTARRLEAEVSELGAAPEGAVQASQWLTMFEGLARPDIGLSTVEVDSLGNAQLAGQAATPQALAAYVKALEQPSSRAPLHSRALEVRQDEQGSALLRFQLRAILAGSPAEGRP